MARTDHNIVVSVERLKDLYAAALGASGAPRQILQSTR
jgi:hypothetical protein